jgi:hypothetical protein
MVVTCLAIVVIAITLLPRWTRYRVRVTGVSRVRSEMARHQWLPLPPLTPVGGYPSPRNEPPAGPEQPDDVRGCGAGSPPTIDSAAPHVVRHRHRVAPSDPSLSATLHPGWRF